MTEKELADTYGVLVRAGAITPQAADETELRAKLNLPAAAEAVAEAWREDGGVRRPITLAAVADGSAPLAPDPEDA